MAPTDNNAVLKRSQSSSDLSSDVSQLLQQLQHNTDGDGNSDDSTQQMAAEELSLLTRKPSYRTMLMEASGSVSTTIVGLLGSSNPATARYAAAAVCNIAIEPAYVTTIAEAGCLDRLLELLHVSDDSEALLAAVAGE